MLPIPFGEFQGEPDVFQDVQGGDQVEELEDKADILAAEQGALAFIQGGQRLTIQMDFSPIYQVDTADQVQEGAFPVPFFPIMATNSP
ncbi:MAG: hypothetical protein MUO62_06330 [Anaerolineales bacterium]|nr:hypothetical protein [Anaerolineales bacterium]